MIGVLDVLDIELPVVVQDLRGRAEDFRLAAHDPADLRADQVADIFGQRRRLRRQRAEDEPGELVRAQFFQPVLFETEALRHAALAADAAAERDAGQIAGEIVAPGMIDAGQPVLGVAALLQADEIAAMGAAVDHRMDLAVLAARDDDRRLAEKRRLVVARLGQFVGEAEILPGGAEKDRGRVRRGRSPGRRTPGTEPARFPVAAIRARAGPSLDPRGETCRRRRRCI